MNQGWLNERREADGGRGRLAVVEKCGWTVSRKEGLRGMIRRKSSSKTVDGTMARMVRAPSSTRDSLDPFPLSLCPQSECLD